jgi:hypothetical protein
MDRRMSRRERHQEAQGRADHASAVPPRTPSTVIPDAIRGQKYGRTP